MSDRVTVKQEGEISVQYFTVQARCNDKKFPKVDVTYRDFKYLEVALNNNLKSNDIECPQLDRDGSSLDMSIAQDKDIVLTDRINNIKRFTKCLADDSALQIDPFYDFFKIPKPDAENLDSSRMSEVEISTDKYRGSIKNVDATEGRIEFDKKPIIDFCGFFIIGLLGSPIEKEEKIEGKTSTYYYFSIKPVADPDLAFTIEKRYSEFFDLVMRMKVQVKARPPPLPPKLMLKDKNSLMKRGEQLEDWIAYTLNQRMFFCPELFDFIGMGARQAAKYMESDMISLLLSNVQFKFTVENYKSLQNSDESFISWEVKVECEDNHTKDLIDQFKVHRRFKEFDHLHADLKHEFQKFSNKMPELPGKLSYLNILGASKNNQRKEKLDFYIRALASYPNIFQSIVFRKFIDLTTEKIDSLISNTKSKTKGFS